MHFVIEGREEIEAGVPVRTSYVIISITDPGKRPARIPRATGFWDILRLQFHDAVPVTGFTLPSEIVLMNEDHAKATWQFVQRWCNEVETIVVHCEQGISRSPAVAAAICKVLGDENVRFFGEYMPNRYIYNLLVWRSASEMQANF